MLAIHTDRLNKQIELVVRETLDLFDAVVLTPDTDLMLDIGLASIDVFEAITALDTLLGANSTHDTPPRSVRSIRGLSTYVVETFTPDIVDRFLACDVRAAIADLRSADTL